jgi:putative transposase
VKWPYDASLREPKARSHFAVERPNELWLADVTYVSTWQGWSYAAFILDVFSRMIVGWQIADHPRTDLILDALEMAIWRRDTTDAELRHHSDARCQLGLNRSSQPSGSPRPASPRRTAPSATATTTPWPKPSAAP